MSRAAARNGSPIWRGLMAAAIASAALLGCAASPVSRGADFYLQGRYIDADQLFEQAEPGFSQLAEAERARYALYRAATYLALGDYLGAQRWLTYGARLRGTGFSALSGPDQQLLQASLRSIGGLPVWTAASDTAAAGLAARAGWLSP